MTVCAVQPRRNAVPRHSSVEGFQVYAHAEIAACTPWQSGVCFLPECGRQFVPRRDWQMYCCTACERAGTSEMRTWGHRLAFSSLVYRAGKYEKADAGVQGLSRAARRHVSYVQSEWIRDRSARAGRVSQ
jgi:hypothetical protein